MSRHARFPWAAVLPLLLLSAPLPAQPTAPQPGTVPSAPAQPAAPAAHRASPAAPRTIHVPASELPQHIRGLVPLRRSDFARLWPLAAPITAASAPPLATLASVHYRLALAAGGELTGEVVYEVRTLDDRPAPLVLDPGTLAWTALTWEPTRGAPLRPEELVMGAASDGKWRLLAPQSGRLRAAVRQTALATFPATASTGASPASSGELPALALPTPVASGAHGTLTLDLPEGWTTENRPGVFWGPPTPVDPAAPAGKRLLRREAALNGSDAVAIALPPGRTPKKAPRFAVREANHYALLPGQIELEASLELDILSDQLESLILQPDPGLTIQRIRWGAQALTWSASSGERRLNVVLPEPLRGASRLVQVSATAPWGPGERLTLPRIRIPQAAWRQGSATVATPPWLAVDCEPSGGRLTLANLDPAGQSPDLRQFVYDEPAAQIDLLRCPPAAALTAATGIVLTVAPHQLTALLRADLHTSGAALPETICDFAPGWLIESVDTQPSELIESRTIQTQGDRQRWLIRWKEPLGEQSLRLVVRARRPRLSGETLRDDDCCPLAFPQALHSERLLAAAAGERRERLLLARSTGVQAAALGELTAAEAERVAGAAPGALLFRLSETAGQPLLQRESGGAETLAAPHVEVVAAGDRLTTHLSVHGDTGDEPLDRLQVVVSPPPTGELIWTLTPEPAGSAGPTAPAREVVARRLADASVVAPQAVAWELSWQPPVVGPFELQSQFTQPFTGPVRASLILANDRIGDVGQVDIRWAGAPPAITHAGLTRIIAGEAPPALAALSDPPLARDPRSAWSYRYDADLRAALTLAPPASAAPAERWCEQLTLHAQVDRTGQVRTLATLLLSGDCTAPLRLRLPTDAVLLAAQVAGQSVDVSPPDAYGWRTVPLMAPASTAAVPAATAPLASSVRVTLTLSQPPPASGWLPQFRALALELDCPLAQRTDLVCLPQDCDFLSASAARRLTTAEFARWIPSRLQEETLAADAWRLVTGEPAQLLIYYSASQSQWAALVLLFAWAWLGALVAPARFSGCLLAAVVTALASLGLPPPWALLAEASAAGCLLGALASAWAPRLRRTAAPTSAVTRLATASALLLLLAMAAPGQPPAAPERLRIVDPLDDQLQPSGDYLYVSPTLYETLFLRGRAADADQPACLVRSARYELRDVRREGEARPAPQLLARLELQLRDGASRIELPFRREQLRLGGAEDSRTGRRLAAEWSQTGDQLLVEAPASGIVQLKLELWPQVTSGAPALVNIPRCPQSQAELPEPGEWSFAALRSPPAPLTLGAVEQLRLVPATPSEAPPAIEPEVEQVVWWQLRENSALAQVQLRPLRASGGEVRLRVDGALRPAGGAPTAAGKPDDSGALTYALALDPKSQTPATAEFVLPSAPTGAFTPPAIPCLGAKVVRRRLLVSFAAELDCTGPPSTLPANVARPLAPTAEPQRLLAYELGPAAPLPVFAIRGVQPRWTVAAETRWRISAHEVRGEVRCALSAAAREPSELLVDLPPRVTLYDVQAIAAGVATAVRWRRRSSGRVSVLLARGAAAPRTVSLFVGLPRTGDEVVLPAARLVRALVAEDRVFVYRTPNLQATAEPRPGWEEPAPPPEYLDPVWGRALLVLEPSGDLATSAGGAPASAGNSPAESAVARCRWQVRPAVTGALRMQIQPGDTWSAGLELFAESGEGVLDSLTLEAPSAWQGRWKSNSPALRVQERPSVSPGRRLLELEFATPQQGGWRASLSADFPRETGDAVSAPRVRVLGPGAWQTWLALPGSWNGGPLAWRTSGLRPAEPGAGPAQAGATGGPAPLWEATSSDYDASADAERRERTPLRVDWCDAALAHAPGDRRRLSLRMGIVPRGAASCEFAYPGARLLAAAIAGRPARVSQESAARWRVELLSPLAPQELSLLWECPAVPSTPLLGLSLPEVPGAEIAWSTVRAVDPAIVRISAPAARQLLPGDWAQQRFDQWAAWQALERDGGVVWDSPTAPRAWRAQWETALAEHNQSAAEWERQSAPAVAAEGPLLRAVLEPAAPDRSAAGFGAALLALGLGGAALVLHRLPAAAALHDVALAHPRWGLLALALATWVLGAPLWLPLALAAVAVLPSAPRAR